MTTLVESVQQVDDAAELMQRWLDATNDALLAGDHAGVVAEVLPHGWWRDQLALSWDMRTAHGTAELTELLGTRLQAAGLRELGVAPGKIPTFVDAGNGSEYLQAFITFRTAVGRGEGVVRLMPDEHGTWRAWTVLTALAVLDGHEEAVGPRRPTGTVHGRDRGTEIWPQRRERQVSFEDREPEVVIVGAGQSGLALAARLGRLGVDALVIDSHERVGDNWRKRYRSLVLHDPVWYDHLPYLPFPESWPIYTPKDKLAHWLESYAEIMELAVWSSSTLVGGSYDDETGRWSVHIQRGDGTRRELRPRHLVMATGGQGEARIPEVPGLEEFRGTVIHSSKYVQDLSNEGRRAVVVGSGVSGHDIAQDLHTTGAHVTLVQRSSTYVVSSEHGISALFGGLYAQDGPPTEDADLLFASLPYNLLAQIHVGLTAQLKELDADLLAGLERVGFKLDYGDDGSGLFMKALRRGGGYYIDVGASGLIASGEIALAQGAGIAAFDREGVLLEDGRHVPADLVVLATGYESMSAATRRILGDVEADRSGESWGLDDEGEIRGVWRPSGHPGLWYMGGNLQLARYYSRALALQLKGRLAGLI
jgi:cation diffusion facilitator CzcD-associated flavoprotein CzcO